MEEREEDMLVGVVDVNLDRNAGLDTGLGQDLVGIRVSNSEKGEVIVNEEEGGQARVLNSEKVDAEGLDSVEVSKDVVRASGSNGDIAEPSFTATVLGSKEVETEESFVRKDEAQGMSEVVKDDAQGNEAVESTSSEPQCIVEQPMVCDQEVTDGGEALDTSKISESLTTMNPGSEDVDVVVMEEGVTSKDEAQNCVSVDPSLVCPEVVNSASVAGDANVHPGNLEGNGEADKFNKKEGPHLTTVEITQDAEKVENGTGVQDSRLAVESTSGEPQAVGETGLVENVETEKGLTKNEGVVEQSTVSVPEVAYENGVLDDKSVNEDEAVDTRKIPESLTTENLGTDEGKNDADMEGVDNAGTDIDEVLGWKDENPETDVITGAGKDDQFDVFANFEAEQGLPESSGKDKEPIVYGRRANVEVPLYDAALDGSRSLVSEDENLDIETDSEEDYEYVQEEESGQSAEHLENGSSFSLHQPRYFQPPKIEGEFAVSDLVWGKVRSHPWWPGQIVDPSDASQKAMKYYKKDRYLVAYFGDHSFAWNVSSVLKPFRANFSQIEKQTNLEAYKDAVECALEEVSRRVELGLACSCIPRDIYKKIECQVIENGGVRQKATIRHGLDESASVSSFEPDKLVDYVRLLAQFPGEGDNMDIAIAKAQLSSYGRYKGYRELTEFQLFGDLLEDAPVHEGVEEVDKNVEKFENNLVESAYPNKERSLSDITDEAPESGGGTSKSVSSYALKKRKARHSISNGSLKKPKRQPEKVSTAAPISTPKPSFKIGRLIQRVASQMTGPPSALKSNSDTKVDHGQEDSQHTDQGVGSVIPLQTPETPQVEASVAEMLSQLHLTAQDPMKNYTHLHTILPFFYNRRADVYSKSLKKSPPVEKPVGGSEIKASDENDPEKIIQNTSEEQLSQDHQNGGIEYQVEASEQDEEDKPAKRRRGPYKKKVVVDEQDEEDKPAKGRRGPYKKQVVANEQDKLDEQDKPAQRRRHSKKQVVASEQDDQDKQEDKQDGQDKQEEQDKPAKIRRRSKKQVVASEQGEQDEQDKPAKKRRRSKLEKLEVMEEEEPEIVKRRRENLATEIVLKFTEGINFASVNNLNKTFRRFGPLMESETEVDKEGGRARVVFKKCSDAEVAHSSAGKFKIFGSIDVTYELNYTPLVSYRPLPLPSFQDPLPLPSSQDPLPHPSFQDPLPLPSFQDPLPSPSFEDTFPLPSSQEPLPLPSSQEPLPLPSSQDPLPLPSSQDPLPLPSSQDPFPLPSSQEPLPLPSSQDPLPLPSSQDPLPLPSSQDPFPLPSSQEPLPLPSSQDPLPLPSSQDPLPLLSLQEPLQDPMDAS
ncbi:PWWP-like protein [Artemisia annua]|uniref:PWWP-like protein n=1 Tax=Artemisia annua TaxID=35608 RepID=A0A2U1PS65_ARTAN|nr:PWWP-like protein [Artemisia annua]